MKAVIRKIRLISVTAILLSLPLLAAGQDLGSTSGLFRSKPAPKKPAPTKKATPKKTTTSTRSSAKPKRASTSKPRAASTTAAKTPKTTAPAQNTETPKKSNGESQIANNRSRRSNEDVIITVGQPSRGSYSEGFETAIADGNAFRNRRLYVEAEEAYSRARSISPSDSRAIYGLGNIYSDQQRWEEAEAAYRQALDLEPSNPLANIALSFVLTQPVAGTNIGERYVEADVKAKKAIELDPQNAIGYDQLGVAMELRGIIAQETEDAYRKAISLDPTFALAYAHLGRLLRKKGLTNESSAAYRQAISLSADVPTMILVADVMQSQQRYLDSEQLLREALRRDPRNPTGLYLLGRALTTRKSFDEAESVLKKSVSVSPRSFVSYTLLGSVYLQSGDLVQAEQTLNRALSVVSENEKKRLAQEFELVGDGLMEVNRFPEAVRVYNKALTLDGQKSSLSAKITEAKSRI